MWIYEKKLEYPVKIATPDPKAAKIIISQLGGPDGELGAATRYLQQRYSMPYAQVKGMLTDIGISVVIKAFYVKVKYKRVCLKAYPHSFRSHCQSILSNTFFKEIVRSGKSEQ